MKRTGMIMLVLLMLSACAGNSGTGTGTGGADQQYTLRLNLKPGQEWTAVTTQVMHQEMTVASLNMTESTTNTTTMTATQQVLDVSADGNTRMVSTFTGMDAFGIDSDGQKAYAGAMGTGIGSAEQQFLLNQPLTITVAPNAAVISMEGFEELLRASFAQYEISDEDQAQMDPIIEAISKSFQQAIIGQVMYPAAPIEVGDSWQQAIELDIILATVDMNVTYTLREVTADGLVIDFNSTGKSQPGASPMFAASEGAMTMDLTLTQSGSMTLDPETFWVVRQHVEQQVDGSMSLDMGGMADQVQEKLDEVDAALGDEGTAVPEVPVMDDPTSMTIPIKQTSIIDMYIVK